MSWQIVWSMFDSLPFLLSFVILLLYEIVWINVNKNDTIPYDTAWPYPWRNTFKICGVVYDWSNGECALQLSLQLSYNCHLMILLIINFITSFWGTTEVLSSVISQDVPHVSIWHGLTFCLPTCTKLLISYYFLLKNDKHRQTKINRNRWGKQL